MISIILWRVWVGIWAALLFLAVPVQAAVFLDTGTPNEEGNVSVFADPSFGAQFVAQEFTLTSATDITTIEAYIGGEAGVPITMDLATAIGSAATAADLIDTFVLTAPGTSPNSGAFVAATVNQTLAAGTYFLVFSAGNGGGFMPIRAPNTIGDVFLASAPPLTNVNLTLPIASNFRADDLTKPGIRISAVPVPAAVWLLGSGLLAFGAVARQRKETA